MVQASVTLVINGFFGFILGFKFPHIYTNFGNFKEDPASVLLSGEGHWLAGLVVAAVFAFLKYWDAKQKSLDKPIDKTIMVSPHERIMDITVVAAISGVLGAKLFAIFESTENIQAFMRDPLGQLLSGSGLAVWGGVILGFLCTYLYVKSKGIKPIHMMDSIAPSFTVGYAVGRIGCQLSGDGDWGIANPDPTPGWWFLPDSWWSYSYPRNVLENGERMADCVYKYCFELNPPVFPTPIYETIMSLIILGILWPLRKKIKSPGTIFFLYIILLGIERFWIEKIRVNPDIDILGMQATQAEYIAILMVIGGIIGLIWSRRKYQKGLKV